MCVPCALPWLAAFLAKYGLDDPWLPAGIIRYILAAFATYRLVDNIRRDEGPFGITEWFRKIIGCYDYGTNGLPKRFFARMIMCPHCTGMLCATLFGMLALYPNFTGDVIMTIFGVAGFQSLLHTLTE